MISESRSNLERSRVMVASHRVVQVLGLTACLENAEGPSRESLCVPAKERTERNHAMALDQSALPEVLEALQAADVEDRIRQAATRPIRR
jgi:hypothetical protein